MMERTYLLTPPASEGLHALGRTFMTSDLIARLKAINPRIALWEQFPPELWWPGKEWQNTDWGVKSSLWLGAPGEPGSQKITAINLTMVPEFTQEGPTGETIVKGWRQIFEKVIKAGAATRAELERAFQTTLYYSDDTVLCHGCTKAGRRRRHNGGVLRLCNLHEQAVRHAAEFLKAQAEGEEAISEFNESTDRRLEDVDVQVRGESQLGWTPAR